MSHTPGPWKIGYGCGDQDDYFTICSRDNVAVADYSKVKHDDHVSHKQMQANARLIAAAPDLLASCQRLLPLLTGYEGRVSAIDEAIDLMRSAIHKAI